MAAVNDVRYCYDFFCLFLLAEKRFLFKQGFYRLLSKVIYDKCRMRIQELCNQFRKCIKYPFVKCLVICLYRFNGRLQESGTVWIEP